MIREMQYLHGDQAFRMYDENFRKLRETVNVPWQNVVQELRLKAATTKFQFQVFNKRLHTCVHRAFSFRGITFARREKNKTPFLLFSVCRQSDWGMRFDQLMVNFGDFSDHRSPDTKSYSYEEVDDNMDDLLSDCDTI